MGVHTGDSVCVAPQQTLTDRLYQQLRDQAIAVMRAVGVETGGSNVQFAVNPATEEIVVIEMNPRVSRSSALASKATGFPIAKIAARLAVGYTLEEIDNDITMRTPASFEPTIDYVVVKWPRFAFEKFPGAEAGLTTHMKSVGEVMAIGRTFGQAFAKAMRSRELDSPADLRGIRRGPARPDGRSREPSASTSSSRPSAGAPTSTRSTRGPASIRGSCASCAIWPPIRRAVSRGAHLQVGRHLRRRVRGRDAVLLLGLGTPRPGRAHGRGAPRRPGERRDPRRRPEPHRAGHRVRLLLRARRDVRPRVRTRRRDGQLQPRDGLHRLRHLRPAVLRAAHARGRPGGDRGRAAGGRHRPVRRPDAAEARRRPRGRRRPPARHLGRRDRPGRGPRAASGSCSGASATRRPRTPRPSRSRRRWPPRPASASRCWCARPTCWAAARWRSSTTTRAWPTTWTAPVRPMRWAAARSSSTASWRTRSRSTSTRSATASRSGSAGSCSTSRRPASTPATPPASCRRTRSAPTCSARIREHTEGIALAWASWA